MMNRKRFLDKYFATVTRLLNHRFSMLKILDHHHRAPLFYREALTPAEFPLHAPLRPLKRHPTERVRRSELTLLFRTDADESCLWYHAHSCPPLIGNRVYDRQA